jgi:hypothetical protein
MWNRLSRVRDMVADPEFREELRKADVILGVDRRTGQECGLFYGVSELKRIPKKDHEAALRVLRVPVDQDTDEPELLAEAVVALKGSCCFPADAEEPMTRPDENRPLRP